MWKSVLGVVAVLCLAAPDVRGAIVNVDFATNGGTYAGTGVIGTGTTWNGVAAGATQNDLNDENGVGTDIDVTSNSTNQNTHASRTLNGSVALGDIAWRSTPFSVTLSGLSSTSTYDLVLFGVDGYFMRGADFTIGGDTKSTTGASKATFVEVDNYVRFSSIAPTANQIVISIVGNGGDPLAHINGLQIEEIPEPSTLLLTLLGFAGLAFFGGRRRCSIHKYLLLL